MTCHLAITRVFGSLMMSNLNAYELESRADMNVKICQGIFRGFKKNPFEFKNSWGMRKVELPENRKQPMKVELIMSLN